MEPQARCHVVYEPQGGRQRKVKCYIRPVALCAFVTGCNRTFALAINLASLAAETGYSKSHFLRAFQASIGATPHRYLIHLCLEGARTRSGEKPDLVHEDNTRRPSHYSPNGRRKCAHIRRKAPLDSA